MVDEPHVRQVALEHAIADHAVIVQRFLDADQVRVRAFHRGADQEAALARADLEDHGIRVAEQLLQVESMKAALARIDDELRFGHAARKLPHA